MTSPVDCFKIMRNWRVLSPVNLKIVDSQGNTLEEKQYAKFYDIPEEIIKSYQVQYIKFEEPVTRLDSRNAVELRVYAPEE